MAESGERVHFGSRLREHRLEHELTQMEMAKALGVCTSTICRWESGELLPSRRSLVLFGLLRSGDFKGFGPDW